MPATEKKYLIFYGKTFKRGVKIASVRGKKRRKEMFLVKTDPPGNVYVKGVVYGGYFTDVL
jgi:hypothetical protein